MIPNQFSSEKSLTPSVFELKTEANTHLRIWISNKASPRWPRGDRDQGLPRLICSNDYFHPVPACVEMMSGHLTRIILTTTQENVYTLTIWVECQNQPPETDENWGGASGWHDYSRCCFLCLLCSALFPWDRCQTFFGKKSLWDYSLENCSKLPPSSQKTWRPNIFLLRCFLLILVRKINLQSTNCTSKLFFLPLKLLVDNIFFAQRKVLLVDLALPTVRPKLIRKNQPKILQTKANRSKL